MSLLTTNAGGLGSVVLPTRSGGVFLAVGGFESYLNGENPITGTASIQSSVKRSGGAALRCNPTLVATGFAKVGAIGADGFLDLTAAPADPLYCSFYFRAATLPLLGNEAFFATYFSAGAVAITGLISDTGSVTISTPGLGDFDIGTLSVNTWYRVDIKQPDGAAGAYEVKFYAEDLADGSSGALLFQSGAADNWTGIVGAPSHLGLGKVVNTGGNSVDFFYDDWAICSTAHAGPGRFICMLPNGQGTYNTWTGTFADVDEGFPDDGDTTYCTYSLGSGIIESVTLTPCGLGAVTINATVVMNSVRDEASASQIRAVLRTGGTDYINGSNGDPGASYAFQGIFHHKNPGTTDYWTKTLLDSAEVGVRAGNAVALRWTMGALGVHYTGPLP